MNHWFQSLNSTPILGKRYKLVRQLGTGGFGQTFLAQDLHLPNQPLCVVKHLSARTNNAKRLQTARRLFDTEAKVLYQLGSHDQIPCLLAHFEENQEFYLVQEFVEGTPLTQQFIKEVPWSEGRVVALLTNILEVLAFVHQQNVIHRDIKPSNLMIRRRDSKIVLIDFGAVKEVSIQGDDSGQEVTDITVSIGTHGYIPSEQLAGKPRYSSDVYAVGMTCIQALTGVHPKQLGENPQTGEFEWHIHALTAHPELRKVLDRMVRYDFRERYATAVEALEAVRSLPVQPSETEWQIFADVADTFLSNQAPSTLPQSTITHTITNSTVINSHDETSTLVDEAKFASNSSSNQNSLSSQSEKKTDKPFFLLQKPSTKLLAILTSSAVAGISLFLVRSDSLPQSPSQPTALPSTKNLIEPKKVAKPSPVARTPEQQAADLMKQADRLQQQKQYKEALATYDKVAKLKPKMAEVHLGRCLSLNGMKQPAQAIVACDDALVIKPKYPEAMWGKGRAFRQQQRSLEALSLFERATALKSNFPQAWVDRGSVLQELGRSVEAIAALDQAIKYDRNSAEAWSIRGSALWNLGRYDQAISSLDKALQIQPNARTARNLREQARRELGY
jgi:eukaryotic-like serine/threonine-protein kinase